MTSVPRDPVAGSGLAASQNRTSWAFAAGRESRAFMQRIAAGVPRIVPAVASARGVSAAQLTRNSASKAIGSKHGGGLLGWQGTTI